MIRKTWMSVLVLGLVLAAQHAGAQRVRSRDTRRDTADDRDLVRERDNSRTRGYSRNRDDSDDAWLSECRRDRDRYDNYRSCDVRVSTVDARSGGITIDPGVNGGASVVGWDRDQIEVHARIQGQGRSQSDAEDALRATRVTVSSGEIRASTPDRESSRSSSSVEFVVFVPRATALDIETVNGPIGVRDVVGRMQLSARNGPITLDAVGGDVHARAQNGPLTVELSGSRWEGEGLDAETRNGPVRLTVPRDYNAELETGTVNGPAYVGFPMTVSVQGRLTSRIHTTLGRGGARVRAVTTNGPLTLDRP